MGLGGVGAFDVVVYWKYWRWVITGLVRGIEGEGGIGMGAYRRAL